MPKLDLTVPAGSLSSDSRHALPEKLAETLLKWEGAPDTEFFRSIAWAHLHELPADAIRTPDGEADPHAVIDITIPGGALSDRRKAGMVEEMTNEVLAATGWGDDAALRVWVIVHEVPDGNWGAGKQIIRFEQLRETARAEREKEQEKEGAGATA
jgi:phenylpyruvate tautomerase PptA (4-oxalocrotonate tautomerase family)